VRGSKNIQTVLALHHRHSFLGHDSRYGSADTDPISSDKPRTGDRDAPYQVVEHSHAHRVLVDDHPQHALWYPFHRLDRVTHYGAAPLHGGCRPSNLKITNAEIGEYAIACYAAASAAGGNDFWLGSTRWSLRLTGASCGRAHFRRTLLRPVNQG